MKKYILSLLYVCVAFLFSKDCLSQVLMTEHEGINNPTTVSKNLISCNDTVVTQLNIENTGTDTLRYHLYLESYPILNLDFENNSLSDWNSLSSHTTANIVSYNIAKGNYALELAGGNTSHYEGISYNFTSSQPTNISFWVNSTQNFAADGYFVIGNSNDFGNGMVFFFMNDNGEMGVWANNSHSIIRTYDSNQWYFVEFKGIDYNKQVYDLYIDGFLVGKNVPFLHPTPHLNSLYLYNYNSSISYYDEIVIGNETIPWVSITNSSDTLLASDSSNATLIFQSSGIGVGNYNASLIIKSNDTISTNDTISLSTMIQGNAAINFSEDTLQIQATVNTTSSKLLTIHNTACDTLFISNVSSTNSVFHTNVTSFMILPYSSFNLNVYFTPGVTTGAINGNLNFNTNVGNW